MHITSCSNPMGENWSCGPSRCKEFWEMWLLAGGRVWRAQTFGGHLVAYLPHWVRILISMPHTGREGNPVLLHFYFLLYNVAVFRKGILGTSCVTFFRPAFFTLAIAEALLLTSVSAFASALGPGNFFTTTLWDTCGCLLSHSEAGDWKQVDNYVHVHSLEWSALRLILHSFSKHWAPIVHR